MYKPPGKAKKKYQSSISKRNNLIPFGAKITIREPAHRMTITINYFNTYLEEKDRQAIALSDQLNIMGLHNFTSTRIAVNCLWNLDLLEKLLHEYKDKKI